MEIAKVFADWGWQTAGVSKEIPEVGELVVAPVAEKALAKDVEMPMVSVLEVAILNNPFFMIKKQQTDTVQKASLWKLAEESFCKGFLDRYLFHEKFNKTKR